MTKDRTTVLLSVLAARYDEFKVRLAFVLGSQDLAEEALHELYLRLGGSEAAAEGDIRNPASYVFKAAMNTANDIRRRETRQRTNIDSARSVLESEMEAFFAEQPIGEDVDGVVAALASLPERQRLIFIAARLEGLNQVELAGRFGISLSTVRRELRQAADFIFSRFPGRRQ